MIKTKTIRLLQLIPLATFIAGCADEASPPIDVSWPLKQGEVISCDNYATSEVNAGVQRADVQGILNNNVWNHKATELAWSQCLLSRQHEGVTQVGWAWAWPVKQEVIFAQPQIKVGASPWQPKPSMNERFPSKIKDLKSLQLGFDVETQSSGNFNLAATLWLTREAVTGDQPQPNLIATEVMVWPFATPGQSRPGGKRVDLIAIDDQKWEVWHEKNWVDVSGENDNKWSFLAFRAQKSSLKGDIDLLSLLNYAVDKGLIDKNHFVADLELGNEVMSGQGNTWVRRFQVNIETK